MENIIGIGQYGYMSRYGSGTKIQIGRLRITSDDIRVDIGGETWDYLVSGEEMYGAFRADGLLVTYAGEAIFELEKIRR